MDKRFFIKIYDLDGTYRKTLNPSLLMREPSFSDKIGGGQGQCVLQLNLAIDDFGEGTDIDHMKVVKIYESDQVNNPEPVLIYTGFISAFKPSVSDKGESVSITLLGLVSMLTFGFYKSGSAYTFTKTAVDPADIIKEIIDTFATVYTGGWISYSGGGIDTVGTPITFEYATMRWYDALKKTAAFADEDWWWRVGEDGQVTLQDRPATVTHILTLGKDVEMLEAPKSNEKIANYFRLTWGLAPTTTVYQDAPSQSAYGLREEKPETDSSIRDSATADQYGNKIIADYKDPKVEARVVVNTNYNIESIKPGHTVSVRNAGNVLPSNMLITSIQYTPDKVTLTLENEIPSLADTFVVAVEDVI